MIINGRVLLSLVFFVFVHVGDLHSIPSLNKFEISFGALLVLARGVF
jgi:hypothetical protein